MNIYIVTGSEGQYSDWTTWDVCAYTDEALARSHVERAEAVAREHREATRGLTWREQLAWQAAHPNPMDPDHSMDVAELPCYTVSVVQLRLALPD